MEHKIKIHHVTSPKFTVNEKEYYLKYRIIKNFSELDSLIEKELKMAVKFDYNIELAIYSFTTMSYKGELIQSVDGEHVCLFMRHRFFKSDGDHLPISIKSE